jgi:hypothetical protein
MIRTTSKPILLATAWLFGVAGSVFAGDAGRGAIHVARADCRRLVAHRPDANVAYQPGVDVHGRPVAPADLPGGAQVALPDVIPIVISVDIQERFGIPANSVLYEPNAYVGLAVFRFSNGEIRFNGQPLTDPEQTALAAACAAAH